jgi:hypothetical protein
VRVTGKEECKRGPTAEKRVVRLVHGKATEGMNIGFWSISHPGASRKRGSHWRNQDNLLKYVCVGNRGVFARSTLRKANLNKSSRSAG